MTCYIFIHLHRPRVHLLVHARDCLPVYAGYRDRLPDHASSATFPFFITTRGGEPAFSSG
ncbi:hypothetical protein Taro_026649 [Colocasia esculenta]|uniref:Uncharacterized protein n=1 Tax=Colocasia esculenta TaxID=4460 RepID=A0A843VDH8_COLES|nr:hypothetical protein [Colocasia esculenta]